MDGFEQVSSVRGAASLEYSGGGRAREHRRTFSGSTSGPAGGGVRIRPGSEGRSGTGGARTAEPHFAEPRSLVAVPAGLQPLRRSRSPAQSLPGLLPRARSVATGFRVSPMCNPNHCRARGLPRADRGHGRTLSGLPRESASIRPGGRSVELRAASRQSRSPDEVLSGSGGCGSPRTTSRARVGGTDPTHRARRGDRAAAVQTPPPPAWIQPRRRAGDHGSTQLRPATPGVRTHRPAPLAAPGQGPQRGGEICECREGVHGSPVAGRDETSCDCRRCADHRRHRIRAVAGAPGAGRGMDRSLVLRQSHPRLV